MLPVRGQADAMRELRQLWPLVPVLLASESFSIPLLGIPHSEPFQQHILLLSVSYVLALALIIILSAASSWATAVEPTT